MKFTATLMLCDHAAVAEGKLYIAGGGWSLIGPQPSPTGIAVLISVPWDQANMKHRFEITLERADGEAATRVNEFGVEEPIRFEAEFEVGRPPGVTPGSALQIPIALTTPPLPLEPGSSFRWVLKINDLADEDWVLPFQTRPAVPPQ